MEIRELGEKRIQELIDIGKIAVESQDKDSAIIILKEIVELSNYHNFKVTVKVEDEPWAGISEPEYKPEGLTLFNTEIENIIRFVTAGHALFTIESEKTQKHYTYQINRKEKNAGAYQSDPNDFIYFCSVMTGGADSYSYMAVFDPATLGLRFTAKSKFTMESPAVKALLYFFNGLRENKMPEALKLYHAGKCGKCGRTLTDPESIELGIGPICRKGGIDE